MTRLPHDAPELESWFRAARRADRALAPGPEQLQKLAARLGELESSLAPAAGVAATPLGQAVLGVGAIGLVCGAGLVLNPLSAEKSPAPIPPSSAVAQEETPDRRPPPSKVKESLVSLEQTRSGPPLSPVAPRPRSRARPSKASSTTWAQVNDAMAEGDISSAKRALEKVIADGRGTTKEKAELALAQLELRGPRAEKSRSTLRRLAASAAEPSVRERARKVLEKSE